MTLDDFIEKLADGGSNDAEIAGLTAALREAVALLPTDAGRRQSPAKGLRAFEKKLPRLLREAKATRF
jgi:hypothetical protein